jgi:ketosteroid isomerase-like protein
MLTGRSHYKPKKRAQNMNKILTCLAIALISFPAMADKHGAAGAEVKDALKAFNAAYATNNVDDYFKYYADDAMLYWDGARQDLSAYHEQWVAMIEAGGGVEKNELSDIQVKVLPGGDAVAASYFIDYRLRTPDGEVSEMKAFETDVWLKIGGAWKLVSLNYTEITPAE